MKGIQNPCFNNKIMLIEAVSKCFPLTAAFKIKSKFPDFERGKAKILTTPLKYSGTGIHALSILRIKI